jgi:hypothetical protein
VPARQHVGRSGFLELLRHRRVQLERLAQCHVQVWSRPSSSGSKVTMPSGVVVVLPCCLTVSSSSRMLVTARGFYVRR